MTGAERLGLGIPHPCLQQGSPKCSSLYPIKPSLNGCPGAEVDVEACEGVHRALGFLLDCTKILGLHWVISGL